MEDFYTSVKDQGIPMVFSVNQKLVGLKYYNPFISGNKEGGEILKVYSTQLEIDPVLAKQFKDQFSSFMYPIGYENKELSVFKDNFVYYPEGFFETLINKIAWFIFYLEIFLSFLAVPWVLIEWYITQDINN
jgi:hypothetical protein